jgi:hypothetical protein
MLSFELLCCVALVKNKISEERRASIIRVTRIGELGTTLAVTSNRHAVKKYYICPEVSMDGTKCMVSVLSPQWRLKLYCRDKDFCKTVR